jgi:hypothetical protein
MQKNKTENTLFALILIMSMVFPLAALSTANAGSTRETYAFIGGTPNPVGVGQEILLHVGITQQLSQVNQGWNGLSVTIKRPDGTSETISGIKTDSTGGTGVVYSPSMLGNYTFQTHFPEQNTTSTNQAGSTPVGTLMLASDSDEMLVVVLPAEEIPSYPPSALPTEYWTRPISAESREWSQIAGSWMGVPPDRFVRANDDAPETAHMLWTKPVSIGGLVGGDMQGMGGPVAFENGAAYEQKFGAPIVLGGILFYNRYEEMGGTNVVQEVVAVDLHTGEELWVKNWNNSRSDLGQLFYWQSYNYMGTFAYLWEVTGTTWKAFDAFTGRWIYTMTNVPATISSYGGSVGSNTWFGERGEIYSITANLNNGWMALWNSSRVVSNEGSWRPHGNTYDCTWAAARHGGYEWNITIPKGLSGSTNVVKLGESVVGSNVNLTSVNIWAISLASGSEGQLLFNKVWKAPSSWEAGNQTISWQASSNENLGFVWSKETRQWWCFSLKTGDYLWGPTASEQYLGIYGTSTALGYGKFYQCYMSGIVYCYDIQNGKLLWTQSIKDPDNEILWSDNWPMRIQFIVDDKIYLVEGEHSPNQPLPRGGPMVCLNATTGELIWSVNLMYYYRTNVVIGDDIIALMNSYDQQVYAIGKGPSATTVTAPDVSIELGKSVMIKGKVTDTSPGTEDYGLTVRFPNGVPAVSDESMSAWMEYVYQQAERPNNTTGVPVSIDVIDSNGNFRNIGTATSDASGVFNFAWQPDISGTYTVIATFAGSKAYYPSYAETAFVVDEPTSTSTPTAIPIQSVADQYFVPAIAGIIAAIAIVGAVLALLLLKKKA